MEENNAQQQNFSQLCKLGCGFFGSSNFDGLCSQCYKDKQQQQCGDTNSDNSFTKCKDDAFGNVMIKKDESTAAAVSIETSSVVKVTSTTVAIVETEENGNKIDISSSSESNVSVLPVATTAANCSSKKSRCVVCRKKLGLTGFGCRCGGEFCSIHRYSDSHSCTFDYKIDAENAIRKANPRIVSNKVSKI